MMPSFYANFLEADDTKAGTSKALAKKHLQNALDLASGGDTVFMNSLAPETLAAEVNFTAFPAGAATSMDAWLKIVGLNFTTDAIEEAELDGNDEFAEIFDAASGPPSYVQLESLYLHSATGGPLDMYTGNINYWSVVNCKFADWEGTYGLQVASYTDVLGCEVFDSDPGTTGCIAAKAYCCVAGNHVHAAASAPVNSCIYLGGAGTTVTDNLLVSNSGHGVRCSTDFNRILGNTIIGNQVAARHGITVDSANAEDIIILSNMFHNWGIGGSGRGLYSIAGSMIAVHGYNVYSTCDADTDLNGVVLSDWSAYDVSTTVAFADIAGEDFTPDTNARAVGWPRTFPGSGTTNYIDAGAVQRQEPLRLLDGPMIHTR